MDMPSTVAFPALPAIRRGAQPVLGTRTQAARCDTQPRAAVAGAGRRVAGGVGGLLVEAPGRDPVRGVRARVTAAALLDLSRSGMESCPSPVGHPSVGQSKGGNAAMLIRFRTGTVLCGT